MQATFCPFQLEPSWKKALSEELEKPYLIQLAAFLEEERAKGHEIYPPEELVFNAFYQTPFDQTRVVIVGQDPYHGPGQAHGLSFSVPPGVTPPPSLKNIYKELHEDLGLPIPEHGTLTKWARQGVLLLNATLTVRKGTPLSHHGKGWEAFTDAAIHALSQKSTPTAFVLWGKSAQEKCRFLMDNVPRGTTEFQFGPHLVLLAAHPSPFSCANGFFGCRHFSKINDFLEKSGQQPIDWSL